MPRKPSENKKTKSKSTNGGFIFGLLVASVFFIFILPRLTPKTTSPTTTSRGSTSEASVMQDGEPSEEYTGEPILTSLEQKTLEEVQGYFYRIQAKLDEQDKNGTERIFHVLELEDHIHDLNNLPSVSQVQQVKEGLERINRLHYENGFDKREYRLVEYKVSSDRATAKEIAVKHRVSIQEITKFNHQNFDRGGNVMRDKNGRLPILTIYQKR